MYKWIFSAVVLLLGVADFGANAATSRTAVQQAGGRVATRSTTKTNTTSATNTANVVARAATTQKALNPGTKVASAAENTAIPKDCQDAFFGCMDAFCMLDNASGGRCQCSDRITELDQVLEDILKLDDQTYLMATEGVERIQMGEAADAVISRARAVGDSVIVKDTAAEKRQTRTLDLSMWNNNVFTLDDDNIFEEAGVDNVVSTFADKKGDDLYAASAKMCVSQISGSCKNYGSMLQLVYAQKIKSDCTAYENSLRAQKIQSQQKLLTAEKALRDAALDEYQNQNKYATVGECAIAFTECMQTTAGCGADYTGCVTLAAAENVRNNTAGSRAKQTKIKGVISGADISLAASTMSQLISKKLMCESVTKQCINANKNDAVWEAFLSNAAPALKSAELVAEQNLRSNCLPSVAECYKTACKAQFTDEENYDMCLSNPETYKSLCKVQLEPCLEATGGSYDNPTASSLWNGLVSLLNAMKVDACTAEVKSCLTERCGDDYSECIGLDVEAVGDLCPYQKLTACMTADKTEETVREYVGQVAMGLALQVTNALTEACQNAANDAMIRVCGDTESCESVTVDLSSLESMITPMVCKSNNANGTNRTCYSSVTNFSDDEVLPLKYEIKWAGAVNASNIQSVTTVPLVQNASSGSNGFGISARLVGRPVLFAISYDNNERQFMVNNSVLASDEVNSTTQVVSMLNNALERMINSIKSDVKVNYCLNGRSVSGFNGFPGVGTTNHNGFANLTNSMETIIADKLVSLLNEKNSELDEKFADKLSELNTEISKRIADIARKKSLNAETQIDARNMERCTCDQTPHSEDDESRDRSSCLTVTDMYRYKRGNGEYMKAPYYVGSRREVTDIIGSYDAATNVCTLNRTLFECRHWIAGRCKQYGNGTVVSTTAVQMDKAD